MNTGTLTIESDMIIKVCESPVSDTCLYTQRSGQKEVTFSRKCKAFCTYWNATGTPIESELPNLPTSPSRWHHYFNTLIWNQHQAHQLKALSEDLIINLMIIRNPSTMPTSRRHATTENHATVMQIQSTECSIACCHWVENMDVLNILNTKYQSFLEVARKLEVHRGVGWRKMKQNKTEKQPRQERNVFLK